MINKISFLLFTAFVLFSSCKNSDKEIASTSDVIVHTTPQDSIMASKKIGDPGVQMIPIKTSVGTFNVWIKKEGNSPTVKALLLHGGPAATHEYFECFSDFFPGQGWEIYYYDQLGSFYSDYPESDTLWTLDRFVDEVEQVRVALGLNKDNFYLIGNSWGGILGMEYALKYQDNMKGLVVANMMGSFDAYEAYNAKLRAELRPSLLDSLKMYEDKGDYHNPEYVNMVFAEFYTKHLCRLPEWPEAVNRSFGHLNQHVYELMQGPSEFVPGGRLKGWSVMDRLNQLHIPTLMIGAKYDTMDPEYKKQMAGLVQKGRYLYCSNGSHLAMWDDQKAFFDGLIQFVMDVEAGKM